MSRTPIVVVAGAAAAVVATALLLGSGPGGSTSVDPGVPSPSSASGTASDGPGGATGHTSGPRSSSGGSGTPDPSSTSSSSGASVGSDPIAAAQPSEWGIESQPEPGGPGPHQAGRGPGHSRAPTGPVLKAAPHSVVADHTRSRSGGAVQVAITASSPARADAVLLFYRNRLGRLGFRETPAAAVSGSTAASFHGGKDSVVVTVTPQGDGGVTYSVFGILRSGTA